MEEKEIIYDKLSDEYDIKVKRIDPIEHVGLCAKQMAYDAEKMSKENMDAFVKSCLSFYAYRKKGTDDKWENLLNDNGSCKINLGPSVMLDLFLKFRVDVILPVFYESKTFQSPLSTKKEKA